MNAQQNLAWAIEQILRPIVISAVQDLLHELNTNATTPAPTSGKRYLNTKEAAEYLGIKEQTLYQNINKIPHVKRFGKLAFLESDLADYMEGGRK